MNTTYFKAPCQTQFFKKDFSSNLKTAKNISPFYILALNNKLSYLSDLAFQSNGSKEPPVQEL